MSVVPIISVNNGTIDPQKLREEQNDLSDVLLFTDFIQIALKHIEHLSKLFEKLKVYPKMNEGENFANDFIERFKNVTPMMISSACDKHHKTQVEYKRKHHQLENLIDHLYEEENTLELKDNENHLATIHQRLRVQEVKESYDPEAFQKEFSPLKEKVGEGVEIEKQLLKCQSEIETTSKESKHCRKLIKKLGLKKDSLFEILKSFETIEIIQSLLMIYEPCIIEVIPEYCGRFDIAPVSLKKENIQCHIRLTLKCFQAMINMINQRFSDEDFVDRYHRLMNISHEWGHPLDYETALVRYFPESRRMNFSSYKIFQLVGDSPSLSMIYRPNFSRLFDSSKYYYV